MRKYNFVLLLFSLFLFYACGNKTQNYRNDTGDTLKLEYAKLLTIVQHSDYVEVSIANPWRKGTTLHKYILIDADKKISTSLPKGTIVRTPLKKSVVFTTAHASLLGMLQASNQIAGVTDLKYMLLPDIKNRVSKGLIADCGDAMAPNIEKIIDLSADAILLSPFDNSGGYGRLEDIGIPIIECADYMELSALGRAEWMKFYGLLYGKKETADSLFSIVCKEYNNLTKLAQSSNDGKSILTERLTGSTWYVAGGQSSVGQLIADANGKYALADDKHSGSIAYPFETVLDKFGNADVWIFNHYAEKPMTYSQLLTEHHGYKSFKAFNSKNVFYVNSSQVPYFEEVSFRPDYLLRDYIILLHPNYGKQLGELRYYRKLIE